MDVVDGLGVRVKRDEQALTAAGLEWMADCFIEIGKSGGMCQSGVLLCLVRGRLMGECVHAPCYCQPCAYSCTCLPCNP